MKNPKMNKRNKLPLLLGILLLISAAAYGTRAYFSDSASEQAGIELTLGNLKIESVKGSLWKYIPLNEGVNTVLGAGTDIIDSNMEISGDNAKNITNVQPGDKFERVFTFKNTGSLVQVVTVDNAVKSTDNSIFKVEFKQILDNAEKIPYPIELKENGEVQYKMTISVKTDESFNDTHNNNEKRSEQLLKDDLAFKAITKAVTVTAKQVNDSSK